MSSRKILGEIDFHLLQDWISVFLNSTQTIVKMIFTLEQIGEAMARFPIEAGVSLDYSINWSTTMSTGHLLNHISHIIVVV